MPEMTREEALTTIRKIYWGNLAEQLAGLILQQRAQAAAEERARVVRRCIEIVRDAEVIEHHCYERPDDGRATLEGAAKDIEREFPDAANAPEGTEVANAD